MAVKNSLKWTILAYASEPDKNYKYDGDIVEYEGKRYFVSLAEERVEFLGLAEDESSPLKDHVDSIENILERADVEWFIDPKSHTRIVISKSDKPLTEDEKAMLKRMWKSQGDILHTIFK